MIDNASEVETSAFPPSMGSQVLWCGSVVAVSIIALLWGGKILNSTFVAMSFGVFEGNQEDAWKLMRLLGGVGVAFYFAGFFLVIRSFRRSMRIHADLFDKLLFLVTLAFCFSAARLLNTYL
uniref:hypothetical protein n=1 Tax=Acidovorax sp. SUPP3334 TaxID=2920881 RepID=UPI00295293CA|nr:hypothetical protein [Acidovorax sp. SUPP3334]BDH38336.1 hypothetical protein AVHM3334_23055 [Acidovorax sp. SUPP3334]